MLSSRELDKSVYHVYVNEWSISIRRMILLWDFEILGTYGASYNWSSAHGSVDHYVLLPQTVIDVWHIVAKPVREDYQSAYERCWGVSIIKNLPYEYSRKGKKPNRDSHIVLPFVLMISCRLHEQEAILSEYGTSRLILCLH